MIAYEGAGYEDVLKSMDLREASFRCEYPCRFLESLEEDDMAEFIGLIPYDESAKGLKRVCQRDICTGDIFISERDAYGRIYVRKLMDGDYRVLIVTRPAKTAISEAFTDCNGVWTFA